MNSRALCRHPLLQTGSARLLEVAQPRDRLLHGVGDVATAIERLVAYESVGAHILYAPGLASVFEVRAVVDAVVGPVNVLTWPGLDVATLADVGVARISTGSRLFRSAYASLIGDAAKLLAEGEFVFPEVDEQFADLNLLMSSISRS